jgi:hypothetical protein
MDAEWERYHSAWKESILQGGYYNMNFPGSNGFNNGFGNRSFNNGFGSGRNFRGSGQNGNWGQGNWGQGSSGPVPWQNNGGPWQQGGNWDDGGGPPQGP